MKVKGTYQKKLRILLFGAFVLVAVCYLFAFSKTIDERSLLIQNRSVVTSIENSASVYEQLNTELRGIKAGKNYASPPNKEDQELIIELINKNTAQIGIRLIEMPEKQLTEENGFYYSQQSFVLQGDFFSLLLFTKELEGSGSSGRIASAEFYQFTDKKNGRSSTRLKLYMQHIKANE